MSQEERSRYEALALISEQDDPEMALDLLLGLVRAIIFSYQQTMLHTVPPSERVAFVVES